MRLSTDADRDEARALDTLRAALDVLDGLDDATLFLDTAHAYGHDDHDLGHNERLIARSLADRAHLRPRVVVVTKAGMTRPAGRWEPDGRASSIRASAERSLLALGASSLDLLLLHAPDPRVPFATSVRALASLVRDGLASRVGLSNVTVTQLREASDLVAVSAVEVALSPFDDTAIRGGVVAWCTERGVPLLAHSPLGGPKRVARLVRNPVLAQIASRHDVSSAALALAWLRAHSPVVVPIPGARRPENARDAMRAFTLTLDDEDRTTLAAHFDARARPRAPAPPPIDRSDPGEVVILMGIPGAGKSTLVRTFVERGYERLNRDLEGGTLRKIHRLLDARLAAGTRTFVLDNTHATRASRHDVVAIALRHGVPVRCVWLDTSIEDAHVNAVDRLIASYGELPDPALLKTLSRKDPHAFLPTVQHRFRRELEAPSLDEGFSAVEVLPFVRTPRRDHHARAVVLTLDVLAGSPPDAQHVATIRDRLDSRHVRAVAEDDRERAAPLLVIGWLPDADADCGLPRALEAAVQSTLGRPLDLRVCPHPGGPPICWCRPPLPGLLLSLVHRHRLDPAASTLVGTSTAHRNLASAVGLRFEPGTPP